VKPVDLHKGLEHSSRSVIHLRGVLPVFLATLRSRPVAHITRDVARAKAGLAFPCHGFWWSSPWRWERRWNWPSASRREKDKAKLGMFRQVEQTFQSENVILGDRILCAWFLIASLIVRRVEVVLRLHGSRKSDFRRGRPLGQNDHIVRWKKSPRPSWMTLGEYAVFSTAVTQKA